MTTDLVIMPVAQTPAFIKPDRVNVDLLEQILAEEEARGGIFPGTVITFKKGKFFYGFGKEAERFDERTKSLILNIPNMWFGWQFWDTDGKPTFGPIARPTIGERLPDRKTLGHTDKETWEVNELNGKPKDPWTRYAAIPFRFDGEPDKVNTLFLGSWSSVNAVRDLLKDYAKKVRSNFGKLPVVNLGSKMEPHWELENVTFDVPTFDIIDWDFPTQADVGTDEVTAEPAEAPQATVTARKTAGTTATVEKLKETTGVEGADSFGATMQKIDAEDTAKRRRQATEQKAATQAATATTENAWKGDAATGGRRRSGMNGLRTG